VPEALTYPPHLYLHIPFCQRRCAYCDFNTYANMEDRIEAYVQALCTEIGMLADLLHSRPGESIAPEQIGSVLHSRALQPTIFFGGGTPSMLTPYQFEQVLCAANALVPLDQAEVTIEANPGSVLGTGTDALDYLRTLRALGINRLSLGVQSLHDPLLRVLGRTHTAAEAYQCFNAARRAGFDNINLDFIFGLPGQTLDQWQQTLGTVATWGAEHFSLYSLILEESTPMYAQVTSGHVSLPDDDDTAAMYESAIEYLGAAGYTQYEISNWARQPVAAPAPQTPTFACQHNLAYWLNSDYLAAGAGAHGHLFPQRYANIRGVDAYIASVRAGQRPLAEQIDLVQRDLCAETMFMGLRLNNGVAFAHFRVRCSVDMYDVFGPLLRELCAQGLLEHTTTGVRLTPRGRMLGNQVFAHFVS
jgi:oxygen-independent coproporphyrinogen-3 oxidase